MSFYPRRSEVLETIARNIISKYDESLLYTPAPIPVELIMEKVYGLTIEYQYIRNNGRILGETVFEDAMIPIYERENKEGYKLVFVEAGTVILDMSLLNCRSDGRLHFTCGHELSHWVIDKEYFAELGRTAKMTNKPVRSSEVDKAVEYQADRMAGCILMPKCTLKKAFYHNFKNVKDITAYLASQYEVSKQAMGIRLREMGLLP